jgi:group I intron endonuclease
MTGIYAIENIATGEVYVGQSRNIPNRYQQHLSMLERGEHHSIKLQKDYNKVGVEGFTLKVLELCSEEELDEKEQYWIQRLNAYNKGYNMRNQTELRNNYDAFQSRIAEALFNHFEEACRQLGLTMTEAIPMLIEQSIKKTKRDAEFLQSLLDSYDDVEEVIRVERRTVQTTEEIVERRSGTKRKDLSEKEVKEIFFAKGSNVEVGKRFGVSAETVRRIKLGLRHAEITAPYRQSLSDVN